MRKFLFLGLVVFAFSCGQKPVKIANTKPYDSLETGDKIKKVYYLDSIDESYFNSIQYVFPLKQDTIPLDTSKIIINKDGIKILLYNNDVTFLKNDSIEGESYVIYNYIETLPGINSALIDVRYYEMSADLLINLTTGQQTGLYGTPLFSPDRQFIISYNGDLESGESHNAMQLFKVNNGTIEKIFEEEIADWEPTEIKWASDSVVLIKRATLDKASVRHTDYVKMKI